MSDPSVRVPSAARARRRVVRPLGLLLLFFLLVGSASAQTATLSGFVTDASDGQGIELVNVVLTDSAGTVRGAVTNRDGLYLIPRLAPGTYALQVSFIGYDTHTDTLTFARGEKKTQNVELQVASFSQDEVVVSAEREAGGARTTAGQTTIRPKDIELVPTPDVSGDLASYLTTQPGVVSTGDRGGQLFIRGGEPSQNLVQLDGMVVYQPFHVLGFYSAFPSDILSRTDIYAGGYGSRHGERISSVIDVWAREGNKRRFAGAVSVSPFLGTLQLEGPLLPDRVSFLLSARQSLVEQGAERYVNQPLPFVFNDGFAKLHAELTSRSRLSLTGLRTYDRGTLTGQTDGVPPEELRWENLAGGMRYVLLPRILPISAEINLTHSRLASELGPSEAPTRASSVSNTNLTLDATFWGERVDAQAGLALSFISTTADLGGLFQNTLTDDSAVDHLALYVDPEFKLGGGLRIRPGARMQFYAIRFDPFIEPRLRIIWERGAHQLSGAAGIYHQEIVGLNDRRDAASVFTAWTNIPKDDPRQPNVLAGRIPSAIHALAGYRGSPAPWLDFSIEGYHKWLDNLFVPEWTSFPQFTTRLQPASGRSVGFDVRVEMRARAGQLFLSYGLANTRYASEQESLRLWYGDETLDYRPPHDRRHQLNAVLSTTLAGFNVSTRWEFGSGLPFSQPIGFDGFVLVNDLVDADAPRSRRVIYERPFNAVLPTYHRMDVSVDRTFTLGRVAATIQASAINLYDRRNIFYLDIFTLQRVDQLPFIPSVGLKVAFQ